MTRTTARPFATVFSSVLGVTGIVMLAGCTPQPSADAEPTTAGGAATETSTATEPNETTESTEASGSDGTTASSSKYADGTYTAEGSYSPQPGLIEKVSVTLTLVDDVIEDVEVTGNPQKPESERYQGEFIGGISDEVVGKSIDDISVSRVAGSSLTSGGFNQAVETIKAEAAA